VRWIEPDVNSPGYVFVAIEAGALIQSHDGGRTWIDRVKQGPYDTLNGYTLQPVMAILRALIMGKHGTSR
jgi:photosystem II stability/assembly factor-like uncharacterized protein